MDDGPAGFGLLVHDQGSLDATFQVYFSKGQRNIKPAELWNDPVTLPRLDIVFRDEPNNIHAKVVVKPFKKVLP